MSTISPNQPNRPPQPSGYKPITLEDLRPPARLPFGDLFAGFDKPVSRWAAAPFFGFICFFTQRTPGLGPLLVLLLLGCLLARLEGDARKIAGVPLTLSAIKLAFQMMSETTYAFWNPAQPHRTDDACFFWLPLFFSACLAFIGKRESATFKIVLAASCVLLASGLLPGQGFVAIFYLLDYILFVAMIIGIFVDVNSHVQTRAQTNSAAAH